MRAVILLALAGLLSGCRGLTAAGELPPHTQVPAVTTSRCPRLLNGLEDISTAANPEAAARERGFEYRDGRVFVSVVLWDTAGDLARRYDLHVVSESRESMTAFAPVDSLCALSKESWVRWVSRPGEVKFGPPRGTPGRP